MIAALLLAAAAPTAAPVAVAYEQQAPEVEIWDVDQLRLPPDTPEAKLRALEPDHTMDDVVKHLKQLGVTFERTRAGILPDRLPPDMREQIAKLPAGEPFVIPASDFITINVILARKLPADSVRFVPRPIFAPAREA